MRPLTRLLIVGAGGHGRSVAESVELAGSFKLAGFADDAWPELQAVWEFPVLGPAATCETLRHLVDFAIVAIGNNDRRQAVMKRLQGHGVPLATTIHPAAQVSRRAVIGMGCVIMAGAVIGTEAILGDGVIVNCGAVVDHDCHVEDYGHLGVGACMSGGTVLETGAWMQSGTSLGYGARLAAGKILRAGITVSG
jgi:sugar O-acyltransferase (sialic acid O-acetyltransferase NeuD family)